MPLSVQQVEVETMEPQPREEAPRPAPRRATDMERLRFELRRDVQRLERLWTD
jgi:hypothetical protein